MVVLKWLVVLVALLVLAVVAAGRLGWLRGTPPPDLGVKDGRLKGLPATPNCVSSQAALYPDHPMRAFAEIAPLPLRGDATVTLARLQTIVAGMEGGRVVRTGPDYLYAQYTTKLLQFVDDVEFWVDPVAQVVQVRSASRIGHGDRGVNRARVEEIRRQLTGA